MRVMLVGIALLTGLTIAVTTAFAKEGDKSVEASFNYGTESFDGLGGQVGATVGFGYHFRDALQGRADVSYFRSSVDQSGMNVTGTRVPIDLGVRYYYPLSNIDTSLSAYGQGGLEVSFDEWKPSAEVSSKSKTRVGAVIGAGTEYMLDPHFGAIVNLQYHIIDDGYLSTGIGMTYHF